MNIVLVFKVLPLIKELYSAFIISNILIVVLPFPDCQAGAYLVVLIVT